MQLFLIDRAETLQENLDTGSPGGREVPAAEDQVVIRSDEVRRLAENRGSACQFVGELGRCLIRPALQSEFGGATTEAIIELRLPGSPDGGLTPTH